MQSKKMISLKDNFPHKIESLLLDDTQKADVRHLASHTIKNLIEQESPNLLIFPPDINQSKDDIGSRHIFTLRDDTIFTGNIMGFVGYKNTRLRIYSRFAQQDKQDFFMHYMLQKVFAVNLFDLKYNADNDTIFDFLIYLFPTYLKRAMRQGIYREYQTNQYNDSHIRGRIDINRHIKQNIPFTGKIAYSAREYTADNAVTQLIRHTIDYISHHPYCGNILQNDEVTKQNISQINEATNHTFNRQDRQRIINQNLRAIRHPYYSEYLNLQHLCLQILRHDELKYGTHDNEIYGILFDGAWLWEEYLAIVLKDTMKHYTQRNSPFKLFKKENGDCFQQIIPDYIDKEKTIVADAKYIPLDSKKITQGSESETSIFYKTLVYMYRFNCANGLLLYPAQEAKSEQLAIIDRENCVLHKIGIHIPQEAANWDEFKNSMKKSEERLIQKIEALCPNTTKTKNL